MRKFIAVIFIIAILFALVAFGERIPAIADIVYLPSLILPQPPQSQPELENVWPQEFGMFPVYNGPGKLVGLNHTDGVMLRIYADTCADDMESYLASLQEYGFERTGSGAVLRDEESGRQYTFQYFMSSGTKSQLTYSIEAAPPPPPIPSYLWQWRETWGRSSTVSLKALTREDEEGRIHEVNLYAECDEEWLAADVLQQYMQDEELQDVEMVAGTVRATLPLPGGMTGEEVRSLLQQRSESVTGFTEEIYYIE